MFSNQLQNYLEGVIDMNKRYTGSKKVAKKKIVSALQKIKNTRQMLFGSCSNKKQRTYKFISGGCGTRKK